MIPVGVPDVMATLLSSTAGISRPGNAVTEHETYIPMAIPIDSMNHLGRTNETHSLGDFVPGAPCYTLTKQHSHAVAQPIALAENTIGRKPENGGNGDGFTDGGPMYTLNATGVHGVAQPTIVHGTQDPCVSDIAFAQGRNNGGENVLVAPTLTAANDPSRSPQSSEITQQVNAVLKASMQVRRLLPVECERLQGFPDHYTDIKPKGKQTPDGPRYKALGNSWAVPVVNWIGKRIMMVEEVIK